MAEFTFGPFSLSTETSRLVRDGAPVPLRPRAFHALRVLLQHVGAVVTYEALIAEAWEGTHVTRHTVDVTLAELRRRLGEYGPWVVHRGKCGYTLEVPRSDELVRQGWHYWNQRTRAGCERAIECFAQVADGSSADFRAFEGLSSSYLSLAIFGMRCPLDMYPSFLETHQQAVILTGLRPELRCNRAFGLCVFEHRYCEAEQEFLRTLSERPALASSYVRLGMLYGALGRFDEAFDVFDRGRRADPLLPTLAAAEVLVYCWRRDFQRAAALGRRAVELHPHLPVARVNYGQALQCAGRPDEALAQYQIASIIAPDVPWIRALEGACQATLGRRADARAMLVGLQALRHSEYVDAHFMAVFRAALGQRREAVAEFQRAGAENSAWLYAQDVDPMLDAIRSEPGFRRLLRRRAS